MAKWPYGTPRWQKLRLQKLRLEPLCEYCPPQRRRFATEVDHFHSIVKGGAPFDLENLRSSCKSCHSQKTSRNEELHGCDENGMPRDPNHAWNK
ncbi:HNH endonuclease [Desulfococcaceae bacterium OttesenSCG-928-F15]|nr:HNH endonuclease [Desulfococcaceae bacterium OttesenSCG-928-F15]